MNGKTLKKELTIEQRGKQTIENYIAWAGYSREKTNCREQRQRAGTWAGDKETHFDVKKKTKRKEIQCRKWKQIGKKKFK